MFLCALVLPTPKTNLIVVSHCSQDIVQTLQFVSQGPPRSSLYLLIQPFLTYFPLILLIPPKGISEYVTLARLF